MSLIVLLPTASYCCERQVKTVSGGIKGDIGDVQVIRRSLILCATR